MTGRRAAVALMAVLALTSCERSDPTPQIPAPDAGATRQPPKPPPVAPGPRAEQGRTLIVQFQCNRCHTIPGIEPPELEKDCTGCHRAIIERNYPEPTDLLEQWDANLRNMRDAPTLVDVGRRFRRSWFVEFVQNPHDLRPVLGATMPRMALTADQAEAMADYLGLGEGPTVDPNGDAARGRELMNTRGCGACHALVGGAEVRDSPPPAGIEGSRLARALINAPDLRWVRDRYRRDALVAWLVAPTNVKADALMPPMGLSVDDAEAVAAHLVSAPAEPQERPPRVSRPPPLERAVSYEEVNERVFDRICIHCHSDPAVGGDDGGPGNTGGFGYAGKRLDVTSIDALRRGSFADGEWRSVLAELEDGTPRVVAHMLARHDEVAGHEPNVLGMPLGFPPIPLEDIQLVDTWIRQGAPGPGEVPVSAPPR